MTVAFLEASVSPSYAFIVLRIPLPWVGGDGNSARKDFRFARDWLRKGVDFWRLFWTFFYPGSGVGESGHRVRSVSQRLYCINWGRLVALRMPQLLHGSNTRAGKEAKRALTV